MTGRLLRTSAALVTAALLAAPADPRDARAVPLVDGFDHRVDLDGSFKSFFFALDFSRYGDALRAAMALGGRWAGLAMADVRLALEGEHHMKWSWQLHLRSQPRMTTAAGSERSLRFAAAGQPARALPLQAASPDGERFRWVHEVDRLAVQVGLGPLDVIVGRQPITFGVGFVWQPSDLVGTFSPLELDREFKPGVDALRINLALGRFTELALVGAAGGPRCRGGELPSGRACDQSEARVTGEHSVGMARFRTTVADGAWDLGLLGGWVRGDLVGGAFATGTIDRLRLRTEATVTYDVEVDLTHAGSGNPDGDDDAFVRAVAGCDYRFDTEDALTVLAEIYYNGFGRRDASDYLELAQRPRVSEHGEVFDLGVLYAAAGVDWEPHEEVPLSLLLMGNLLDPSLHVSVAATYRVGDESELVAGAFVPVGRSPRLGATGPTARSEYGLYPNLYYLEWRAYF